MFRRIFVMLCTFAVTVTTVFSYGTITAKGAELGVSARSAILIESTTGRVIYGKNQDDQRAMASTTKIMTALLTLEQKNLDVSFPVDNNAIMVEGSSMGLVKDDIVTLRALATGMLLPSGNDAANAAAVKISGSIEKFAVLMNMRAQEIGMENTNFVTPSGLDDEQHYSTAYDMALLAREAIKNPDFVKICSQSSAKVEFGNPTATRYLTNHNRLLKEYEGTIGIKTGFTKKAGRCLVSAVSRDGITLIAVTLDAGDDWQDHKTMYNYGFGTVSLIELDDNVSDYLVPVVGGTLDSCGVLLAEKPFAPITTEDLARVETNVMLEPFCYAPVQFGDSIGRVEYLLDGDVIQTVEIMANNNIEYRMVEIKIGLFERIKQFIVALCQKGLDAFS